MAGTVLLILALLAAAAAFRAAALKSRRQTAELAAMAPASIGDVLEEARAICAQLGRAALQRPCKASGVARPDGQALTAPLSGKPVLWYEATVTHHFWKDHYSTDKHGNQRHRRTRHTEVLSCERSDDAQLLLDDGTGQVRVRLGGAKLDGVRTVHNQADPQRTGGRGHVATGNTIGYTHTEKAIVPGERLFVTGTLRPEPVGDGFELGGDGKRKLLVSTRTEDQVLTSRGRVALAQNAAAAVLAVFAVGAGGSGIVDAVSDEPATAPRAQLAQSERRAVPTSAPTPDRVVAAPVADPTPAAEPAGEPAAEVSSAEPAEPTAAEPFAMPNLIGVDLQSAQNSIQELGVFYSTSHDLRGDRVQVLDSNWIVCTQTPAAGTTVEPATAEGKIDFGVVKRGERCP